LCDITVYSIASPIADPELQTSGEPGHRDPEMRGGGPVLKKIFFGPFGPQFGPKLRGAGPPGP